MVLVSPRMCPETTDTAPNSPIARALHSSAPYNTPHLILGKVTRKKVCRPDAPSEIAASSSCVPWSCIRGKRLRKPHDQRQHHSHGEKGHRRCDDDAANKPAPGTQIVPRRAQCDL